MEALGSIARTLAHGTLRRLGLQVSFLRPIRDSIVHFSVKAAELQVQTVFDIGANIGQFGRWLRDEGYSGRIVSFEPLSEAHMRLSAAAATDPLWQVMPRSALGEAEGSHEINVSYNLASSSLLQVEQRSVDAEPVSGFSRKERIAVHRLDDVFEPEWSSPFAMKLDTQGYELHVLRGAPTALANTKLVIVEMSLVPLYKGGPDMGEVYSYMLGAGFRCIGLTQGFADHQRNELLQVDGIFVRNEL